MYIMPGGALPYLERFLLVQVRPECPEGVTVNVCIDGVDKAGTSF